MARTPIRFRHGDQTVNRDGSETTNQSENRGNPLVYHVRDRGPSLPPPQGTLSSVGAFSFPLSDEMKIFCVG
ncbi:hypothetical protein Scep_009857 [Stephania cephalantha]|uniref:Uncharacterized protein n=1 Tax=Stephania cephalantha TaxID=152367 RepID=A0AAP0JUD1_9MAGN